VCIDERPSKHGTWGRRKEEPPIPSWQGNKGKLLSQSLHFSPQPISRQGWSPKSIITASQPTKHIHEAS